MKIRSYLALAAAALVMTNCSQEEVAQISQSSKVITATIESSSRSAVTDAGVFSWTSGDAISLHDGTNVDTYTYSGSGNDFTKPASVKVTTPVVAYYPASENHTATEFYLPDNYGDTNTDYVASTNAAMIATPPTSGNEYAFMHLGGVMRFNVKNVPAGADGFQFTATGKKITGKFVVSTETPKTITTEDAQSSGNTVDIRFKKLTEAKDMTFYVPMPTGTYTAYTVGLYIDGDLNGHQHTSTKVSNTIARKTLLLMPTFTYDAITGKLEKGTAKVGVIDLEDGNKSADIEASADIVVTPGEDAEATATLNYTPATDGSSVLSISDGSGVTASGDSEGNVVVYTADGTTVASCDINTPSLTVELSAADNGTATYQEVTALTAEQTLIIGEGVTIKKLVINGGNVVINGKVTEIVNEGEHKVSMTVTTTQELSAAINVATEIILGADITSSEIITIDKAITLDGNGKTLTSTASRAINVDTEGSVTIQNLTIKAAERAINIIDKAATVNVSNVTATAKNNAIMIATSAGAAKLTVEDSDLTGLAVINVAGEGAQVEINNTNLTCNDQNANENYGAISVYSTGKNVSVTVNGGKITVKGDSYVGESIADGVSITLANDVDIEKDENNPNEDISYGACYIPYSNQTSYSFTSLAEALEWAKGDETIVLAKNIEITESIEVNKVITIDLNGKTITISKEDEATTVTDFINRGTMTIKNGSISAGDAELTRRCIYNYGTMTIDGVNFTQQYGQKGAAINNEGTMTIQGNTTVNSVYYSIWNSGTSAKLTVENGTFICDNIDNVEHPCYCVNNLSGATLIVNDGAFTGNHGAIGLQDSGTTATLNKGTFKCTDVAGQTDHAISVLKGATLKYNKTNCTIESADASSPIYIENGGTVEEIN